MDISMFDLHGNGPAGRHHSFVLAGHGSDR
jgi:hypothetical protein